MPAYHFEIFNADHQLVSPSLFHCEADAFLVATSAEYRREYGLCHVGHACKEHDEIESGHCHLYSVHTSHCR
jgi:hypothetical protein